MHIDTETRLCAVIGNPVEHSLSPVIHNAAFQAAGLNYVYTAFRVEDVAGCLAGMRALDGFRGLSVTIPHKMTVMKYLDEIEPLALRVGSVNTITNDNGRLNGTTTDGPGTLRAFEEAGILLDGKRVLFIGSGGAVRAVAFAVAELTHAESITVIGRTPARVAAIVDDVAVKTSMPITAAALGTELADAVAESHILIQGTPVGMHPNPGETPVPRELLQPHHVCFDMVYRPSKTRFIQDAEERGCSIILGIEMLLNQAALQFERWTGVPAPLDAMRAAALEALGENGR